MLLIGLTFFNEGAEFMMILAITIQYFSEFKYEPENVSLHIALICLPQGFAFLFGLLSDTTDVHGYGKRFYIVFAALL